MQASEIERLMRLKLRVYVEFPGMEDMPIGILEFNRKTTDAEWLEIFGWLRAVYEAVGRNRN